MPQLQEAPRRIGDFVSAHQQDETKRRFFELETKHLLEVNLNGLVWAKAGSMVAYKGDVRFERERMLEHGVGRLLKKALTGEGMSLMKASGRGQLYLADVGKQVQVLDLDGDDLCVNGNDVLAFEDGLSWDVKMLHKVSGMMAGGLFNVRFSGRGSVAITTHHDPLVLTVAPGQPVVTDPNATVAWTGRLEPKIRTDLSLRTFLGRGSGESIQMEFQGNGFVLVQPYEEVYMKQGKQ